jgi:NAD-dependent SIR2 family protein deacetylase
VPRNKVVGTNQDGKNIYELTDEISSVSCMLCGSKIYPGQRYTTPRITRGYPCCNQCKSNETIITFDNIKVDEITQDVIREMIKDGRK